MIKIAIDGPSGSGKSTLAKALSKKLGYIYVDTGALYRTIGLYMLQNGVALTDKAEIVRRLPEITLSMFHDENGSQHVTLNGVDVGDTIRTSAVSAAASAVSAIPEVRAFLLDTQRNMAKEHNVIMDGRDIGTVIFPDADVKIFLIAGNEARAIRRHAELIEKGENITLEQVLSDMERRDVNDRTRKEAPAIPASDAVMLDNSSFAPEQTLAAALEIIKSKLNKA
ncbi:MAG: (d)CMP kinase [Clostridia bacterium]|nr:(d)CMP kinase [Clostridia bacterium]